MLTDNAVLLNNWKKTPTLMCIQRKGQKKVVDEDDLITSNIAGFGDDIGATTNKITAMFDVMAQYGNNTSEYNTLQYRIASGQLFQQNCIDRIKGVECKPMPKSWYDIHANALPADATEADIEHRNFYISIMADRKPYFMRYIYPDLNREYTTYIRKVNQKCLMEHRKTVEELLGQDPDSLSDNENEFVGYYNHRMPVGDHDCVMNRICHRFEEKFDRRVRMSLSESDFDYTIMKCGAEYTDGQYYNILQLYKEYRAALREWSQRAATERVDSGDAVDIAAAKAILIDDFRSSAESYCPNRFQLCDIVLDICYTKEGSKQFAWDLCATEIIQNLLARQNNIIRFPVRSADGEIEYDGARFTIKEKESVIWQNIS